MFCHSIIEQFMIVARSCVSLSELCFMAFVCLILKFCSFQHLPAFLRAFLVRGCRKDASAVSHSLSNRSNRYTEASTCLCQSKRMLKTCSFCAPWNWRILIHQQCRDVMDAVKSYTKNTDGAAGQNFTANNIRICRKAIAKDTPEH